MDRFKKWYLVKVRCYNCGNTQDCKVPKGSTIDTYLKTEAAQCENCGNPTLRRIERVRAPPGTQEPLQETYDDGYPPLPPLPARRRVVVPPRAARPSPPQQRQPQRPNRYPPQQRPRPRQPQRMEVDYPVTEPVPVQEEEEKAYQNPDWNLQPKKINFWTGREDGK